MSKCTSEQAIKAYYSGEEDKITSEAPESQEGNKQSQESIDELTARDNSNKVSVENTP